MVAGAGRAGRARLRRLPGHEPGASATAGTVMSALANHGIRLRDERPGEHRTTCPRCAEAKHRPRDDALAVKLELDGGATWHCHRCGWKGGLPPAGEPRRVARPPLRL